MQNLYTENADYAEKHGKTFCFRTIYWMTMPNLYPLITVH